MKITVYVKTRCPWCEEVLKYLDKEGCEYAVKNVTENEAFFQEMIRLTGQEKAPVVNIDGDFLVDTDKNEVKNYLDNKTKK